MEVRPTQNGYELGRRLGYQGPRRGLCHSTPCDKSARMTKMDNKKEHLVSTESSQDRLKKVCHDRPKDETELERCEVCLKYFKRGRGLKIYQTELAAKRNSKKLVYTAHLVSRRLAASRNKTTVVQQAA